MPDSSQDRKAVPICTASAPRAWAAAMPRPSMMPPAAITATPRGCNTSTQRGTRAMVPIIEEAKSPRKVPRCPPDSMPEAQTPSAPTSAQATASATVVAVPIT
ncbi:hypothetical protein D3C72_2068260 [compost metagenome]